MAGQSMLLKTFNFMNGWVLSNTSCRLNLVTLQVQIPIRTLKLETKEKLKALKIPEKPKRPSTGYLQFVNEKRLSMIKDNPNLKLTDVIKQLSIEWKTVSDEQKAKYNENYRKEWEIYEKELLTYNTNLSDAQRKALQEATAEKRKDKQKRKLTKLIKDTDKPKRPIGPFLLYLQEQSLTKNVSHKDLMGTLKEDWAKLSEAEKKKYKEAYARENEKYEVLLENWEKKMIDEGHRDLVRAKTLKEMEGRPSRILDLKKKPKQ